MQAVGNKSPSRKLVTNPRRSESMSIIDSVERFRREMEWLNKSIPVKPRRIAERVPDDYIRI